VLQFIYFCFEFESPKLFFSSSFFLHLRSDFEEVDCVQYESRRP